MTTWRTTLLLLAAPGWHFWTAVAAGAFGLQARHLRVLVAEDNPVNQRLAKRILEKSGHLVYVAENGREALTLLAREPVDIVLMDLQMPEMDGLQATVAIRASEQWSGKHLPIVALTAHALAEDRELCLASGMDAYLAKPYSSQDLNRTIAEVTADLR